VPDNRKAEVVTKAEALVEEFLKPHFIKPPPKNWIGADRLRELADVLSP
jgi:hypothetical protein